MNRKSGEQMRPYLVIPKLIEQPTWGGSYIAITKRWDQRKDLVGRKIGQSYELFSGSNLSLLESSQDPAFVGELTDRDAVQKITSPPNSISLASLINANPEAVLGKDKVQAKDISLNLLIKFTQAMGNSFQVHIKDGSTHPFWKPKPESWYYFEPGLITLGVKPSAWEAYKTAVSALDDQMKALSQQVKSGKVSYDAALNKIKVLVEKYDPVSFVNLVQVEKNQLIDLSGGGIHHSWEEDASRLPLGNVLYELQTEAMDDISTLRSYDKGKMASDGSVRQLHIEDYFKLIDRDPGTNDPANHISMPERLGATKDWTLEQLLHTKYYNLEQLVLSHQYARYTAKMNDYRHLFVKKGTINVSSDTTQIEVTTGHACFIPAASAAYTVTCTDNAAEVLISY